MNEILFSNPPDANKDPNKFPIENPEPSDMFPVIPEYAILSAAAFTKAAGKGWKVVLPQLTEIFIDIDNSADYAKFYELFPTLQEFLPLAKIVRDTPSPSGAEGHRHIVVDLCEHTTDLERVLLQAVLGSDRKRELLAWQRINLRDAVPTLFFEKKDQPESNPI